MDNVLEQVEQKVSINDMLLNFKTLNDMLFVKFRQLEDTKQGMRDVLTYVKYFYPLQIQQVIGENLNNLKSAQEDSEFLIYARDKYNKLKAVIEQAKVDAKGKPDKEFTLHMAELDRHFLRSTEWRLTPLENPEHNLVGELFDRYMKDLETREKAARGKNPTPCELLRKTVTHDIINEQINSLEFDNNKQLEVAKQREE